MIGFVYARLSSPLQRKHTIFISENACIARRDGVLKLMFRLVRSIASLHAKLVLYINIEELCLMLPPLAQADVRERQVVNPIVKAFLVYVGRTHNK